MKTALMTNIQLNLVVIRSADIDRSAKFYKLLGLDFIKHQHGTGPEHCTCESGKVVLEIYPRQDAAESTNSTRIGFQVLSVDTIVDELMKQGVKIISPPRDSPWGRRAIVVDPDGHRVELTEQIQEI